MTTIYKIGQHLYNTYRECWLLITGIEDIFGQTYYIATGRDKNGKIFTTRVGIDSFYITEECLPIRPYKQVLKELL